MVCREIAAAEFDGERRRELGGDRIAGRQVLLRLVGKPALYALRLRFARRRITLPPTPHLLASANL
jgi:hypothetical protein